VRYISGLIALINEQLYPEAQANAPSTVQTVPAVEAHYRNILGTC
jgi:hypothetical protein